MFLKSRWNLVLQFFPKHVIHVRKIIESKKNIIIKQDSVKTLHILKKISSRCLMHFSNFITNHVSLISHSVEKIGKEYKKWVYRKYVFSNFFDTFVSIFNHKVFEKNMLLFLKHRETSQIYKIDIIAILTVIYEPKNQVKKTCLILEIFYYSKVYIIKNKVKFQIINIHNDVDFTIL